MTPLVSNTPATAFEVLRACAMPINEVAITSSITHDEVLRRLLEDILGGVDTLVEPADRADLYRLSDRLLDSESDRAFRTQLSCVGEIGVFRHAPSLEADKMATTADNRRAHMIGGCPTELDKVFLGPGELSDLD